MRRYLPVFPLCDVVLPTQVLPLNVFEERYRALMEVLTGPASTGELGVVLIERGSEVGSQQVRAGTGTVVRLVETRRAPDGRWLAVVAGSRRFRVARWLPDDPFPRAEVEEIPDGRWDPLDRVVLDAAEVAVRKAVGLAYDLLETCVERDFPLAADPGVAAWELCAAAPLGPLDRQRLLDAPDHSKRLEMLTHQATDIATVLAFRLRWR